MNNEDKVRYIELKLMEIKKTIEDKDKETEQLKTRYSNLVEEHRDTITRNENYRARIDKAIELLSQDWYSVLRQETINKVKDILQGENNE